MKFIKIVGGAILTLIFLWGGSYVMGEVADDRLWVIFPALYTTVGGCAGGIVLVCWGIADIQQGGRP